MEKDFVTHFCVISNHNRLDRLLANCFPQFSRVLLQQWVKDGKVKINNLVVKPATEIKSREEVSIQASLPIAAPDRPVAMELAIIYEDTYILVINKPSGLTVHPGAGNQSNTLVNALLAARPAQKYLPRAGLIHRLDKGTSGLILIAKDTASLLQLQEELKKRLIERHYLALVQGLPISGGTITNPIGRDPRNRLKFKAYSTPNSSTRSAITHYRIKRKFAHHCLLNVYLETGRTHQIRCHLAAKGYPLVGDRLYGAKQHLPPDCSVSLTQVFQQLDHQLLHARRLSFHHPDRQEKMELTAPLPPNMEKLLRLLEESQTP